MPDTSDKKLFSVAYPEAVSDVEGRRQKARKILAVLRDACEGELADLELLDVGCSNGTITAVLAEHFDRTVGLDVDSVAVQEAREKHGTDSLSFEVADGQKIPFADASFDVVLCNHVYEHVADPDVLMSEIARVLRPGGKCYFAAGNRLSLIEPHHKLPFLSMLPRPAANLYVRTFRDAEKYREKHLTLWGLRKLVSDFNVTDYTRRVVRNPKRYRATDMMQPGTAKHWTARAISKRAYWLVPTYIWILEKPR